jgi:hypothetical protein
MCKGYKKKAVKHIIIVIDFLLLVSLLVQSLAIGCLIAYGYIPIPADWANQKLRDKESNGFHIQADSFRLKLWHSIELIGIKVYHSETEDPILEASSLEVQYRFKKSESHHSNLTKLIFTNGTLSIPAVYSPDGKRTSVLENVTLHLSPTEQSIRIESFFAKHEDIFLRGSIEWPLRFEKNKRRFSIQHLYKLIASALKQKNKVSPFIQPTIEFSLSKRLDNSTNVSLILSCEQLKHPRITGSYFSFGTAFLFKEGQLEPQAPLMLHAKSILFDDLDIFAEDIFAHVKAEKWPGLFNGALPEFEVSAHQLTASRIKLDAPRITIAPSAFPVLQFSGTTCGLEGSVVVSGAFNSADKSGKISANGSFDVSTLLPDSIVKKLPELQFGLMPFYNLHIDFDPGFKVRKVNFHANFQELSVNELKFDNITAEGYYNQDILNIENIHIDRKKQWVDGSYYQDIKNRDFKIYLRGSVLPKQYNSLLPDWWSKIFKDLYFDPNKLDLSEADFAIYGKMQKGANTSLFGHARVANLAYKEALFDTCDLIVRGNQNYIEIDSINAQVGSGRATGKLGFTVARDPQSGLVSVRYCFDALLPVETISNALGGNIADILGNFELTGMPDVQVEGVVFNEAFKEYEGKDSVHLKAKVDTPLRFQETLLDHLKLKLIGQGDTIYLRDIQLGYADGIANARADIFLTEAATPEMCFKLHLRDANQAKAIQNLFSSDNTENPQTPSREESIDPAKSLGLVDLNLHAKGPLTDIYGFKGYGDMEVRNKALGSIQLLGTLSELLKNTLFNFTSFNLDRMNVVFEVDREQLVITELEINGPRTRIWADEIGTLQLPDQALDMDLKVSLFANTGNKDSVINAFGRAIATPLPNLLSFKLTGTIDDQKVRSKFNPINLIR